MAKKPSYLNTKRSSKTPPKKATKKKGLTTKPEKDFVDEGSVLFNAVFKNADIGIVIGDTSGKFLNVNQTFLNMLGYSRKKFLELSIKEITHPQDYPTDFKLFEELVSGKRNQYHIEKRYIAKDGTTVWGKLTMFFVEDGDGERKRLIGLIENITEQKEIASRLTEEQHQFITLLKNSPDSIYFKDLKGQFLRVSNATAKKLGCPRVEDLIGKTDYDIFGPEHAGATFKDEQQVIKTGRPIIGKEEREDYPDGRITWASTSKMPLFNSEGNIIGVFGITRDITERKLIEEKIKRNEELYRALFENSADGMFLMTDVFLDCNQAVCNLFHCEREDVIGHSPVDFSPEVQPDGKNSLASATEKIDKALNGIPQRFYWMHKTKDNILIDAEVSLNAITISGQNLIQAVVRDITERMQSEKVREALYDISEAAYTATDMYMLYEKIHKVVSSLMPAKNFYISLYDEKTEMISFPYFVDEFDPPQPPKKLGKGLTEYALRKGSPILVDAETDKKLRASGEVELVGAPSAIWLGVPLNVGGKTIGIIVVQDYENEEAYGLDEMQLLTFVTEQVAQVIERKRTSDALRKYADELRQLNQTKDKFFSIIAHDLKNPFITIMGFSDLLLSDYEELSDQERLYYIQEMKKSADLSHNLLQNLLQWSRSQTGRIEFSPQPIDIKKVIDENIELLRVAAERKQISMISNTQEDLIVFADEDMLNTILRNLLTNALKFTNKHGVITAETKRSDSFVGIEVKDNGVGMPENVRESLFRLDVSHSSLGTDNEAGTGLGLILCKEFVEKNGGSISVESEVDKGTTFKFTLPIHK
ncbi:MAG: PAS domain S-box protein [Bacteroidetes bacterium]|nr:PAS domain S-box protein [Bacteroidota bacterium]